MGNKRFRKCLKAVDTIRKTADVELVSNKKTGSGFVSSVTGAVKTAADAGASRLKRNGDPDAILIIHNPESRLEKIIK